MGSCLNAMYELSSIGVMSLIMRTLGVFCGLAMFPFMRWSVGLLHCVVVGEVTGLSVESLVL